MGQYWKTVNLDKREFLNPHMLGVGLKLGEQLGSGHGTPDAIFILTTAMRGCRGGGDFDWDSNYHGPERDHAKSGHGLNGAPVVESYNEVVKRTIGRWAGDRVVIVGDYSVNEDLSFAIETPAGRFGFGDIYGMCCGYADDPDSIKSVIDEYGIAFKDITADVARVIEHEVGGKYMGSGWRRFARLHETVTRWREKQLTGERVRQTGTVSAISDDEVTIAWSGDEPSTYKVSADIDFF